MWKMQNTFCKYRMLSKFVLNFPISQNIRVANCRFIHIKLHIKTSESFLLIKVVMRLYDGDVAHRQTEQSENKNQLNH